MRKFVIVLALFVLVMGGASPAFACLIVGAPVDPGDLSPSFVIDLYETVDNTPNGAPTEVVEVVLPENVNDGFLILLEQSLDESMSNWSDILWFHDVAGAEPLQVVLFLSDPNGPFTDQYLGEFNLSQSLILASPHVFIQETAPPTVYFASPNTYNVYSDAPGDQEGSGSVPEPATLSLVGLGLAALLRRRGRRK